MTENKSVSDLQSMEIPATTQPIGSQKPANAFWARLLKLAQSQMALILMIVLIIAGSLLSDVFLTPNNLLNILWATSVLGVVALGQTLLLITCNFDMSVSMVAPFAGIVTVGLQIAGWGLWPSVIAGLASGVLVGFINGAIVTITKANPFLITLGTQTLVYSIGLILTQAKTWYATIPAFTVLGRGELFGMIHYSVIIFLSLAFILEFVLRRTPYGRHLYVLGLNEEAGHLSGIRVNRVKLITFTFCGLTAALAGLIMTSRLNSTRASGALGMDFDSIIAVVLGGTSLFGGSGGTLRTIIGVVVLGILNNLMVLADVPYEAQWIAKGVVFLLVVWTDTYFKQRQS
jgi:ribose transport system permease protein